MAKHTSSPQLSMKSGPGRPTQEQVEKRNVALLNHVMEVLLTKGYDGVVIREVTASLGMAKRTIVARYGNKVLLCKAALESAIDAWAIPISKLRAAETASLETTLLNVATLLVSNYLSPEGLKIAKVTDAEGHRMPEISRYAYDRCTEPLVTYLSDLFRRRCAKAEFPDAEEYAMSFLSLAGTPSRVVVWGVPMDEAAVQRSIRHIVRLFLDGLPR